MDRDVLLRIDSMIYVSSQELGALSSYVNDNINDNVLRKKIIQQIGKSLGELLDIHNEIYKMYPDLKKTAPNL